MKVVLLIVLLAVSGCDSRRVVGQTGQNVTLLCKYNIKDHGAVHVCWGKGEIPSSGCNNQLLSTNGHEVVTSVSSRYQLLGQLDQGDVSLTILNLTEEDAGRYGCRVQINGPFNDQKHHFDLRVERAPTPWAPSEPQTSSERPAAAQTAADQLTTESLLTSCSNSSSVTQEQQQQQDNMLTVVLVLVLFLLAVLLTAAGLFIMARRWKQLKLPPQQQQQQLWHQVQFSSTSSTLQLQLHQRASAVENVYQIDGAADRGGDYEFCP